MVKLLCEPVQLEQICQKIKFILQTMNQLSHGQRINFPASVVRSVSFEKVRQGSLSSRAGKQEQQAQNQHQPQPNPRQQKLNTQQSSGLCQRLLTKKLLTKQAQTRKPLDPKQVSSNPTQKSAQLKKQLQQKQLAQCTFHPKINRTNQPQRTLEQFVDQQMAYEKFKSDKVTEMRELIRAKIDKENTFQPNLMDACKEGGKRAAGQVHERLYEEWTKKRATAENIIAESVEKRPSSKTSTIKQKLTTYSRKNSQKSIVDGSDGKKLLTHHNDPSEFNSSVPFASESSKNVTLANEQEGNTTNRNRSQISSRQKTSRQNSKSSKGLKITKYMDVQQVCEKKLGHRHRPQQQKQKQTSKPNPKNKELYIKKILREIGQILSELSINEPNLTYMQMSLILQKMNFLDEQMNLNDRKYSYEIWQMLQGDVYETCPLGNFVRVVFCLLGCHDFGVVEECLALVMPEGGTARKLVLTERESKSIKMNFQELALNRLRKGQHISSQPKAQPYSFKPFVSKNSTEMAQKYRKRIIQQSEQLLNKNLIEFDLAEDGQVDHIDLLMLDDKCKELKIKMKREQQERERKRLEDEAMLGDRRGRKREPRAGEEGGERYELLYELGKNNIRTKKQKQTIEQLSKQHTFHPNLNPNPAASIHTSYRTISKQKQKQKQKSNPNSSQHTSSIGPQEEIKDFDKSIFRMYEARRIREESMLQGSKSVTDRSLGSEQYRSRDRDEDQPFLYLNVCMEGSDDIKVPVFQSDTMRTITHKVKVLMGLENAEDAKLQEILKLQIMPTLKEIGMDIGLQ